MRNSLSPVRRHETLVHGHRHMGQPPPAATPGRTLQPHDKPVQPHGALYFFNLFYVFIEANNTCYVFKTKSLPCDTRIAPLHRHQHIGQLPPAGTPGHTLQAHDKPL
ncbi:jg24013 [Pararge aegeria aegeria]|uniref:Jg24013 protein n=1 Tax=Pararge aegeria aegeria TaxID=348720 RepID=A0A8S4S9T3_9NEOP|nr:jg24013 [Pararge aegeria aegeria]